MWSTKTDCNSYCYWPGLLAGEGNGTPLQYSCLENPMDGGASWAAVLGVAKSRTWLSDFAFTFHLSCIGEGNGNPLQWSCLENPRDGGALWAAIYGFAQSRTWLKWLSSSSSISLLKVKTQSPTTPKDLYLFQHPSIGPVSSVRILYMIVSSLYIIRNTSYITWLC